MLIVRIDTSIANINTVINTVLKQRQITNLINNLSSIKIKASLLSQLDNNDALKFSILLFFI